MYDSGGVATQYFNLTYDSGASNEVSFDTGASGEYTFNVNTVEKMRIDSSGNVGIGISSLIGDFSNISQLAVSGGKGGIVINSNDTGVDDYSRLLFTIGNSTGNEGLIRYNNNNYHMSFWTDGLERMRIDSSGRLIVNDTSPIFANSKIQATHSSGPTLGIKQTTGTQSAGGFWNSSTDTSVKVISVYAGTSGNEVGTIGAISGLLSVGSGDTGIKFWSAGDAIAPSNPDSSNANRDASIDIGTSSNRFKDLYLSGGAFLGGTGTANKLDDYEEGTWTPSLSTAGGTLSATFPERTGKYTKIGNVVYYEFFIETSAFSGGSG
jgi:hypothetical protein